MAIVIQDVVGTYHNDHFYPHMSGTAQSHNYYPVAHMEPEDGFAIAGLGLGHYVVNGERAYSVQHHPEANPGPHDSRYLFGRFAEMIDGGAG